MTHSSESDFARIFGTFGLYRYILACMVVVTHAGSPEWVFIGGNAVFAFFILSGYVVSYILHYTYLPLPHGVWKYALNRALRIYPLYWMAFAGSIWIMIHYPEQATDVAKSGMPRYWWQWMINLLTIGMSDPLTGIWRHPFVVPVGWTLGVEILFWAMMPKFLTNAGARWTLLIIAVSYVLLINIALGSYTGAQILYPRYSSALAAALPFSIGLLLFIRKLHNRFVLSHLMGMMIILAFILLSCFSLVIFRDVEFGGFYASLGINALVAAYLTQVDPQTLPRMVRKTDAFLGNLAYALYLVHQQVEVMLHIAFPSLALRTPESCVLTLVVSSVLSYALYLGVESPINRLKRRLKDRYATAKPLSRL